LEWIITYFTCNWADESNGWDTNIIILIICVLDCVLNYIFIVFSKLILAHNFVEHFQSSNLNLWRFVSLSNGWKWSITHFFVSEVIDREVSICYFCKIFYFLVAMAKAVTHFV
jgi:hypothetical protein